MAAEVDRGRGVVDLVRQDGQLVVNPLSNRELMQLLKEWLRRRSSGALQNNTRRSVLHAQQLVNTAGWSSVQLSVAVVQPRQYRAARQSERQFGRQKMADVPNGLDVIVACPGHRCRMTFEQYGTVCLILLFLQELLTHLKTV